ncbi:DUF4913 domain-containing protein [Streptomyces canus]|uniref:DUF4913 domain-containing protein n=1 Tax=Streptomyces canus TaxID=58343 RepID=UPI002E25EE41
MTSIVDEWDDDRPAPTVSDAGTAGDASTGADTAGTGKPKGKTKGGKKTKKKEAEEPPPLVFKTVEEFVTEYLAPTIRRKLNGQTRTWCPEWWRHEEALQRLGAIWRAWENLRQDPALGLSTWFLHHCDPHMNVLLDPDGPFAGCTVKDGHTKRPYPPLPTVKADPALWLSPAFSADTPAPDSST